MSNPIINNNEKELISYLLDLYIYKIETKHGSCIIPEIEPCEIADENIKALFEKKLTKFVGNKLIVTETGLEKIANLTKKLYEEDFTHSRKLLNQKIDEIDNKFNHNGFLKRVNYLFYDEDDVKHEIGILESIAEDHDIFKKAPVVYLGAYTDINNALLMPAKEYYFVDTEYKKMDVVNKLVDYLTLTTGEVKIEEKLENEILIEFEDRKIHLIATDFSDVENTKKMLPKNCSGLIIKKTPRNWEAKKYFDGLVPNGYFLESDFKVHKELEGFQEIYSGSLNSLRVFDDMSTESYPAKLWRKQ